MGDKPRCGDDDVGIMRVALRTLLLEVSRHGCLVQLLVFLPCKFDVSKYSAKAIFTKIYSYLLLAYATQSADQRLA